ncbi:hypothetical protein A2U01_0074090, partial [Trifolium medium]|nr:hypothetical protein [Trifolium medium]
MLYTPRAVSVITEAIPLGVRDRVHQPMILR